MAFSVMRILFAICTSTWLLKVLARPATMTEDSLPSYNYGIATSELVKRQAAMLYSPLGLVTGIHTGTGPSGSVPLRSNIIDLEQDSNMWTLYILGLDLMQYTDQSQLFSWYQISGIHGLPYLPWDGVQATPGDQENGYCTHQVLYNLIQQIASFWPAGNVQNTFVAAAKNFRIPYWDWAAAPPPGQSIFPSSIWKSPSITINGPAGTQTIANPLFTFQFKPLNTTELPDFPLNQWSSTMRYPSSNSPNAISQNNLVANQLDSSASTFRDRLFNLFTNYSNYTMFSNEAWIPNGKDYAGGFDSIESIHDQIHGLTGSGGHMTYIDYSAFDPVFWLHHAMIDRCFAMWQALYPNSYVVPEASRYGTFTTSPGQIENLNTPLTPFHSDNNGNFWNPTTARYTTTFGYAYAETANNTSTTLIQQRVTSAVNELYGPAASAMALQSRKYPASEGEIEDNSAISTLINDTNKYIATTSTDPKSQYREWIANIRVKKYALSGPFFIHIFIGNISSDPFEWSFDPNLVGTHSIFVKASKHNCVPCQSNQQVTATIPLTGRLTTDVQEGELNSLEVTDVPAYLKENLKWRVSLVNDTAIPNEEIPDLFIDVVSTVVQKASNNLEFPRWGKLETVLSGGSGTDEWLSI